MVRASKTVSVVFLLAVGVASAADDAYHRQIEQDRRETDEFLRSEKSPLLLIGRFSVNEGSSTLGSDPASTIVLPTRAPQHLGTIFRHGNQFTFEVMMGTSVSLNGKPASGPFRLQVADISKQTDRVSFGDFKFRIRQVGDSFDLLLSDTQSPFLKKFKGTTWFPIDPVKRVAAQFIPAEQKKTAMVPYTDGASKAFTVGGDLLFQLDGKTLRLEALVLSGEKQLFVMFQDQTSGKETYGGGRFLEVEMPQDGKTTLDFNKAYNPYCAYNPYAVCPVPPRQNRLPVPIRAGQTHNNSAPH